ncbi:MAG: glycogen synthase GlgA [Clostridiales bacterium]|nr:glycogen synthase GlgA [Clostridiales bacterium]
MKKILFVGSEAVPFAATGGLGDVLGSLPAALMRESSDVDVRVVMPMYQVVAEKYKSQSKLVAEFTVQLSWRKQYCGVWAYKLGAVTYYFIDNEYYFKRQSLYGSFDDGERYAYFCKAVMEMMPYIDFMPDILNCHDWQSALCVIYLKRKYCYLEAYSNMKAVYTIHNIDYQGIYGFDILGDIFCLDSWDRYVVEYDGCINLTKGAIVCCDKLTTVSPNYANEIQTEYFSSGLHHILGMNKDKICGIINGIDVDYYNPETDTAITERFTLDTIEKKTANKLALQKTFGLPENADVPVIAMVSRLASHKGFDLVRRVADEILASDVQFVLLGTGESELEDFFAGLAARYPDKCGVMLAFDKNLAKQIYASADIFLMPSKSEPCGLAQMIASRYGTVPVVRETGGLYDTIKPFNPDIGEGNGVTFQTYNAHDMLDAVRRTLAFYADKKAWNKLVANAMTCDFSWDASAKTYLKMYESL